MSRLKAALGQGIGKAVQILVHDTAAKPAQNVGCLEILFNHLVLLGVSCLPQSKDQGTILCAAEAPPLSRYSLIFMAK